MSGIDPIVASALTSQIDILLKAISGPTDANAAQAAEAAAPTQWANAQPSQVADVEQPPPASAQAVLSPAARTLDVISRGADGEPAPPVIGRQALWSAPPGAAAASGVGEPPFAGLASSLAMALEQALDTSGLFYESHLAQWFAGQRSSALLNQEPQSNLPPAEDENGWPYDAEAALRTLAGAPEPFTGGRPAASGTAAQDGLEADIVDVDIADDEAAFGAASPLFAALSNDGGEGDGDGDGMDLLDDGLIQTVVDDASAAAVPQNALVPADHAPANAPGAGATSARASANASEASDAYAPTPGSTLFANAGNAAYAAQAAVQVREAPDASASAAERALAAAADNDPTLQASATPGTLPIHPDALSIVRQQLEFLQSPEPRFRWSGEAWPDSRMYWELDWDHDEAQAAEHRVWRTRIAIELPRLGLVNAELTLTGHRLGARITADGRTLTTLKEGTSDFMRALAGAGLNLEQLAIRSADGIRAHETTGAAQASAAPARPDDVSGSNTDSGSPT
ncbi:flagellar hook-length control protein FliK [Pararobbsia silviterrae]|uniref:Flagellar hook-length control protein FliK n=1 Tax=Pararobbsia silviterrae TaxID=1792498 RepID=A0A494XCP3_9BURK|nr:flagellar hook-length control protein FliK [Pararobbsia silviterrae]RKP45343.1 flagellar hook-length control protein FliK [Pararobbsia silviterrae]